MKCTFYIKKDFWSWYICDDLFDENEKYTDSLIGIYIVLKWKWTVAVDIFHNVVVVAVVLYIFFFIILLHFNSIRLNAAKCRILIDVFIDFWFEIDKNLLLHMRMCSWCCNYLNLIQIMFIFLLFSFFLSFSLPFFLSFFSQFVSSWS